MRDHARHVVVRTAAADLPVEAEAVWIGADLLVWIYGGERPHIGAVAAAQPRPSLRDSSQTSATASVLTFLGHKEDVIVKTASERLAAALGTHVVVAAGMHWNGLTAETIATVQARCSEVVERLLEELAPLARKQ